MVCNFFFANKTGSGSKASVNEKLAQELNQPIMKQFKKKKRLCKI